MSRLHLSLLGTPEIRHDEQLLAFSTRKAMALLMYLVVEGRQFSREKITTLFWPESDTSRGRGSLRLTLTYLRETLNEKAASLSSPDSPHLIIERDSLGFNFASGYELDLDTLDSAYKYARTHAGSEGLRGDGRNTVLAQLQRAIHVYRGNFLDGFSVEDAPDFEDWLRLQRESWHRRMATVFDGYSKLQIDGGEIADAIDSITLWMSHDPFNEVTYQRLMQLYFTLGERNSALEIYNSFQEMLAKEFGTEPTVETKTLAEHIRAKPLPRGTSSTYKQSPITNSLSPFADSPLVGRATEYSQLIEAFNDTQHGQARVILLKGEAGIGKTRLASAFLGWAAANGADILQGRAFETGAHLPYQPLVESLRNRLERENAPDDLLSDTWLAELSSLLPELRDRYPDLSPPTQTETTAQTRLFEAVVRLGQALSERSPVVLFIDDAQWADAASLDLLHYAGRRWQEDKISILLLLNVRIETLLSTLTLARWFSGLERDLHATSLRLGLLTLENLIQLFEGLVDLDERSKTEQSQSASLEEFSKWLFAETRGQPFYVMETLKVLLERSVLTSHLQSNGTWVIDFDAAALEKTKLRNILPPNVREVIRLRLAQLTSSAFALLAAFAVLGHNSVFEHACQVAGLSESDGLVAIDELLTSYHLTENTLDRYEKSGKKSAPGFSNIAPARTYYFTHDKIRDVVYSEAGEARRRLFHRRALDVLQAEGDNNNRPYAAELARHAFATGMIEPAFRFSVKAGDDSMRLFAVRDAITQYEQALHVLQEDEAEKAIQMQINAFAPAYEIEHLYLQSGRAYEIVNEFEKARSLYSTLRLIARDLNSKTMDCAAINRLAMLAIFERYDIEQALILLNEALPLAKQDGDSTLLAETEWNIAQVNFHAWKANLSLIHGKRALELARKLGLQELSGRSLNVLAYSRLLVGKWKEAEFYAEEGRSVYSALNNRAMEVDCLCQIAFARICRGQLFEGVSAAQEALSISRSIENTWGQVYSAYHIAMGLLEIGSFSEALFYAQQAVITARTDKLDVFVCINLAITGRVHRAMLNLDAAIAAHKEALAMNESMKAPWTEMITSELCVDCAMSDDWANAYMYAKQALNHRRHSPYFYVGLTHWFETEALVRAGDIKLATEDVKSFGEHFALDRRFRIPYLRSLAVLARYRGEIEQAIAYLQEAEKFADEIELPGELWSIKAALRELYLAQGNVEPASHVFAQAALIARKLSDYFESENQRVIFLESPIVRRLLESSSS